MWKAQYEQYNKWHDMDFNTINVQTQPGGKIHAQGADQVGIFEFEGSFSPNEPKCRMKKQYMNKHAIYYQGDFDQNTYEINGHWGFKPGDSNGKFRMKRIG